MGTALLALLLFPLQDAAPAPVDIVRDVQPILRDTCLECHGEKKGQGQRRPDVRLLAMKGGVSGKAILPGKGAKSLLVKVLLDRDEEVRMPQKADALLAAKIGILRRWIDEGAAWPDAAAGDATLEALGLREARPQTLARRVSALGTSAPASMPGACRRAALPRARDRLATLLRAPYREGYGTHLASGAGAMPRSKALDRCGGGKQELTEAFETGHRSA